MHAYEKTLRINSNWTFESILTNAQEALRFRKGMKEYPLRFVVSKSDDKHFHCEYGVLRNPDAGSEHEPESIFGFRKVQCSGSNSFNVALIVPTGIGAVAGGHAGDATPIARLLAQSCDTLVTHPNVVNGSDINEAPENSLYVEGSVLSRLFMGTVGLRRVRANRVLVIIDAHKDQLFTNAATNAVNAARASYGLRCPRIIQLDPGVRLRAAYSESGRAGGEVRNLDFLVQILEEFRDEYDAVAISSVIDVPEEYHQGYFDSGGEMVNPWGGVEAILTHAVSTLLNVPSAHSPMFESQEIANADSGVVDPRMAAEAISVTFMQCILKGLHRSPAIVVDEEEMKRPGTFTAADISCLVIPYGCIGLPTLAALAQDISVIAVKENKNLMKNDLYRLPWKEGQLIVAENYWEVSGILNAMRAGIEPSSVRRPISYAKVELRSREQDMTSKDSLLRQHRA